MRTLLYCCSVYQVFNAVHIAKHVLINDTLDVMIADYVPNYKAIAGGLRSSGLFESVYEVASNLIAKQKYKHTRWTVYGYRLFPELILRNAGVHINTKYDRYYFATFDDFIAFLYLDLHRTNPDIQCCCYEDGGTTYMRSFQSTNRVEERLHRYLNIRPLGKETVPLLVYDPSLMTFDCGAEVIGMPKISHEDREFIKCINTVFGVNEIEVPDESVIFFEESFLADGLKNNDLELIEFCSDVCSKAMILKPHPRNPYNRFENSHIRIMKSSIPWEVYCLNCDLSGKTLVTINSNAAISPHIIFENAPKSILLFNMLVGESYLRGKPEYDKYYEKVLSQYSGRMVAPSNFDQLRKELLK